VNVKRVPLTRQRAQRRVRHSACRETVDDVRLRVLVLEVDLALRLLFSIAGRERHDHGRAAAPA